MKKALSLLLLAAPLAAAPHPSKLSLGLEGGMSWSGIDNADTADLYGGRVTLDLNDRWAVGGHFQGRTYKDKNDQTQRVTIRSITAAGYYNLTDPATWTPYLLAELGMAPNHRTVVNADRSSQKPTIGIGAGVQWRPAPFNALRLELSRRNVAGASPGGYQVTENALTVAVVFYIPDEWTPIRPPRPLNLPDYEDVAPAKYSAPRPEVEKQQAQQELDRVQRDIRDKKIPPIHFETGQAILLDASRETLDIVGTILRRYPAFSILITGFTDDVGEDEDNRILSTARAEVVRAYLAQNFGLPADKMTAVGAGEDRPIADNTTEDGRFLNRRVEFYIQ